MEGQQRSFVHQQPVRIVPPAIASVYTPQKQRVGKRFSSFLHIRKPRIAMQEMQTHTHDAVVQNAWKQRINLKKFFFVNRLTGNSSKQACKPVKRKQLGAGIALTAGMLLLVLFATGSFSVQEPVQAILLEEDAYISQLLIEGFDPAGAQPDETESLPDIPISIELADYRVQRGDSLEKIAKRFGVRIDTLISVNKISNVKQLKAGTIMKIPNMDGIVHIVQKGDSLVAIAKKYKTDVITLADVNNLESNTLQAKQVLFIPGARLPQEELKRALGTFIQWPIRGVLSSYFGYRPNPFTGIRQFHNGIDIRADIGTAVRAAMDGTVAETGYSTVFGNFIILKHSNGYQTLYGHLSKMLVSQGQRVTQATTIGLTGNTGMTTGPHLHFSIFKNGSAINPLTVLGK